MSKQLYVDVHVLQTVPPSCVNRDDTGSPKTAVYGGTTRARVSSQAWKRAVRKMFMAQMAETDVGIRTKYVHDLLTAEILRLDPAAKADQLAKDTLNAVGVTVKAKKANDPLATDALFFISPAQLKALAELAVENVKDKKALEAAMNDAPALDVALFGRMVASNPELNTDASCQVAHAISTHTVHNEYDYFTAVDDRSPADNAGAAHLDTVEFNSSTLYRYATVCVGELENALKGDTAQVVRDFVNAFITSMPTGKQNTFANRTLPDFVYVTIREDQPINLVGAFEKPVLSGTEGYMQRSADALMAYAGNVYANFADVPSCAWVTAGIGVTDGFAQRLPLRAMLDALTAEIARRLSDEVI